MRVGILGGGQLGTMLAEALLRLGAAPIVYDPHHDAPAGRRVPEFISASFEDRRALASFMSRCDVVTYEREDLPVDALREAAAACTRFLPDLRVLEVAQDRAREKSFLARNELECVRHVVVDPKQKLEEAVVKFGLPAIAKTTRGGYDGKGQFLIQHGRDARAAEWEMPQATWVLEEPVDIVSEASCIVARSESEESVFPVAENLHRDHILDRSLVPGRLPAHIAGRMRDLALSAARGLDVHGLLAVEFFVARRAGADPRDPSTWRVLINELAPRPHNSGHVLSRACTFGQFDALARVLVGAPLGQPSLLPGCFCMGNLLGDVWLSQGHDDRLELAAWRDFPEVVEMNIYGKTHAEQRRKMGHSVVMASTSDDALARAEAFRLALKSPRDY
jgi:5-(carboxyamino)imidazole ribonucleotide synthase